MLSLTNGHFNYLGFALPVMIYYLFFIVCLNVSIWRKEIWYYFLYCYANAIAFLAHCK